MSPLALLSAAALGAALLAGCASPLSLPIGPGGIEDIIEQETGGQVDLGGNASLPADWPSELPLPDGDLIAVIAADGTHALTYRIANEAVAERLVADLEAIGFVETAGADLGELVTKSLARDAWTVTVGWVLGDEIALNYTSTVSR